MFGVSTPYPYFYEAPIPQVPEQPERVTLRNDHLAKFRTRPCNRPKEDGCSACSYGSKCQFNHVDEEPRRPLKQHHGEFNYKAALCAEVKYIKKGNWVKYINHCHKGDDCPFAHTVLEQAFHPDVYKKLPCEAGEDCERYYCPFFHSRDDRMGTKAPGAALTECMEEWLLDHSGL
uniref:C3H1-type domain-containing protein n=1 Tax=Chromera velia CCMP2878 TaxID=1169474 RepID=A0A0G4H0T4_9ALVE|eukprot:Cvel_24204.t1-p1 / transcript=Cvel_24204.t1 / gene=Cvel_24204 / organism=Chromera_velia_CCMP2878 / gene_product=RING finger protein unkempt, putative / transcript_product=RING finger protein unkempt, putative / location=Cvel_scaffold2586:1266-2491(+) / protein_length=174 / sequence_SO=supercontig / SO=protein_coding / is_pseudo=false